jgi:mannose-1-phosphate guanylyltransferase / mannose-6-phosphate isomerase
VAAYCRQGLQAKQDEVLFVTPSGHIIQPVAEFVRAVKQAVEMASDNNIVTLSVIPINRKQAMGISKPARGRSRVILSSPYRQ